MGHANHVGEAITVRPELVDVHGQGIFRIFPSHLFHSGGNLRAQSKQTTNDLNSPFRWLTPDPRLSLLMLRSVLSNSGL